MTANRKRGRPKGTGIDDHQNLTRIADIIAGNPSIKRTTAIKKIGVSNPSIVRRLRDKFAEEETVLMAEARRRLTAPTPRINGTATPRLDGIMLATALHGNKGKGAEALVRGATRATAPVQAHVQAQAFVNTAGQSKKTGPVTGATAATAAAAPAATGQKVRPLPGITALFTQADVSPLQIAEDIVAIRNAILASTEPLQTILTLLKGVELQQIVEQGLGILLGVSQNKVKDSPIASLLTEQAKMLELILPLLQMQFASAFQPAATETKTRTETKAAGKAA